MQEDDSFKLHVPVEHVVHLLAPLAAYDPAEHLKLVIDVIPSDGHCVPAGHVLQYNCPSRS